MPNDITPHHQHDLEVFDPERYRPRQAAIDFGIEEGRRIKDWPTLENAVDLKIAEQEKFIAWRKSQIRGVGNPSFPNGDGTVTIGKLSDNEITNISGITKKQAERIAARLADSEKYRKFLLGAEYAAAYLQEGHVRGTLGTGENEWFTPPEYIELARTVLGEIDLDPATHEQAQQVVQASRYYTREHDGLTREWYGRVWLNPPYAQPWIAQFVEKICQEWRAGHIVAAIMLTHNYTDTAWFQQAAHEADAICFTRGRIKFYEPDGAIAAPTQGQAFFYFGDDPTGFASCFQTIGFVR